jgi:hypothetical protein
VPCAVGRSVLDFCVASLSFCCLNGYAFGIPPIRVVVSAARFQSSPPPSFCLRSQVFCTETKPSCLSGHRLFCVLHPVIKQIHISPKNNRHLTTISPTIAVDALKGCLREMNADVCRHRTTMKQAYTEHAQIDC